MALTIEVHPSRQQVHGCDPNMDLSKTEYNELLQQVIRDGGFYDKNNCWNSILQFAGDDRIYRGRVETLIVKDFQYVFLKKHEKSYRIPGGSFDKDVPHMEQAVNECREEARIDVKNIVSTGISYREASKPPKWAKETNTITWNGKYSEVYIAEYDSKYKGRIDPADIDSDMVTGSFIPIKDALKILSPYHKQALTAWLANHQDDIVEAKKNLKNKKSSLEETPYATESASVQSKKKSLFFLSNKNFDGQILYPRVPANFFTRKGYEDPVTPRICFCSSVDGCLTAIARNLENQEFYVHTPVGNPPIHVCTPKDVPDCVVTHEIWTTGPTEMKCVGKIEVGGAYEKPIKFVYGDCNNEGELYKWHWKWVSRNNKTVQESTCDNEMSFEYAPLFTTREITEKNVNALSFHGSSYITKGMVVPIFESMIYHGLNRDYIRPKNPLYQYIGSWGEALENINMMTESVTVRATDIQFMMQWFNRSLIFIGRCITTLFELVKSANSVVPRVLIKKVQDNKKFVNKKITETRLDMNTVCKTITSISQAGIPLEPYAFQLREYRDTLYKYKNSIKNLRILYTPIEHKLKGADISMEITALHLSTLIESLEITVLNEIEMIEHIPIEYTKPIPFDN